MIHNRDFCLEKKKRKLSSLFLARNFFADKFFAKVPGVYAAAVQFVGGWVSVSQLGTRRWLLKSCDLVRFGIGMARVSRFGSAGTPLWA